MKRACAIRNRARTLVLLLTVFCVGLGLAEDDELGEARRLAQAKHYAEALSTIESVLERDPQNLEARIEYARVLSWAGRYQEAVGEYEKILAADESDQEARLGRARVLYWSGRLDEAAASLRGVEVPGARVLLAEIERARGHNDRALAALSGAGADGVPLQRSIRQELRPVLRSGYGLERDRELAGAGAGSTIRMNRYTASLEFSVCPDVRMEVSTTVTRGTTSSADRAIYGSDAIALSTLARIRFRPAHWLELDVAAGEGSMGGAEGGPEIDGSRTHHFLYLAHPVARWKGLRLDFAASRGLGDYTPLTIHNDLVEQRQGIALSYSWRRLKAGGEWWHSGYNFWRADTASRRDWHTSATGGSMFVTPVLYRSDALLVETGVKALVYGFAGDAAFVPYSGLFTPERFQQYGGTGHAWWRPARRIELDVAGLLGAKRYWLYDGTGEHGFDLTGGISARAGLTLGRVQPFISYAYTSAQSGAAENYKVHAFGAGVSIRF